MGLYGKPVRLPKNTSIAMKYMAYTYEKGSYKNLWWPYWQQCNCCWVTCDKIKPAIHSKALVVVLARMKGTFHNKMKFDTMKDINTALKPSVAIIMAGSRGDTEPMLTVIETLDTTKTDVTVFTPADVRTPVGVQRRIYVDSYKPFIHGHKKGIPLKHLAKCMKNLCGEYDYVIGPHFSREKSMIKSRVMHITLHPILESWEANYLEKLANYVGLTHNQELNVEHLRCIPSQISVEDGKSNLGWPIRADVLLGGETEFKLRQNCNGEKNAYTLITFGS